MFKGKSLLDYKKLFSSNDYEKNDKVILKYFRSLKRFILLFVVSIKNLENLKHHISSIICSKCKNKDEKLFKEGQSIEILKILSLVENI